MSVKTKETSLYGCIIQERGNQKGIHKLQDFCEFLGGRSEQIDWSVEIYQPKQD